MHRFVLYYYVLLDEHEKIKQHRDLGRSAMNPRTVFYVITTSVPAAIDTMDYVTLKIRYYEYSYRVMPSKNVVIFTENLSWYFFFVLFINSLKHFQTFI